MNPVSMADRFGARAICGPENGILVGRLSLIPLPRRVSGPIVPGWRRDP